MFKTVELWNFRCFSHLVFDLTGPRDSPLPYAVIYGRNAAGKTSLIDSISFLRKSFRTFPSSKWSHTTLNHSGTRFEETMIQIMRSREVSLEELVSSNIIKGSEGPMALRFRFSVNGKDAEYHMGFSQDCSLVSESLSYVSRKGRTIQYFEAMASEYGAKVRLNPDAFPDSEFRTSILDSIRPYWGKHTLLSIIMGTIPHINRSYVMDVSPGIVMLTDYLSNLDTSSSGLDSDTLKRLESDPIEGWIDAGDRPVCESYCRALESFFTRIDRDVESISYEFSEPSEFHLGYRLVFYRYISGKVRRIPAEQESAGVKRLLSIFPLLLGCARGKVSFVDEIDSGVHDKLMHDLLIQILPDMKGQLIVTTHNTSLLTDLDPHNVFSMDIDMEGERTIGLMTKGKRTRGTNNNQSRYLRNEFGGLPHISSVDIADIVERLEGDMA